MTVANYAGNVLFGRRYRLIIGMGGTRGIEVTNLKCVFSVEKSMTEDPNPSIIQIYNLAPNTRNDILANGTRVIIEAGYEGPQYGLIYDGDIVRSLKRGPNSIDKITELVAQDGDMFFNNGFVSVSYAAGYTSEDVLRNMARVGDPDITIGSISQNMNGTQLARGKAMFGQPKDYARDIAKGEGALFYICDRKLNMVKPMDLPGDQIISLTPQSGLVGTPEQTEDGIKALCLLNPLLNINKLVYVANHLVQQDANLGGLSTGVYKIISLKHSGDTRGDEWHTEFIGIAQPGVIPHTGNSFAT